MLPILTSASHLLTSDFCLCNPKRLQRDVKPDHTPGLDAHEPQSPWKPGL